MFWKNKELEELKGSVSRLASAIVEKEISIQDVHKKVKDLETMCLTTISQLQNVQLAHADRLKALEENKEIIDYELLASKVLSHERFINIESKIGINDFGAVDISLENILEKPKELKKK